jgi:predicted MFS family arabinose efflux permease
MSTAIHSPAAPSEQAPAGALSRAISLPMFSSLANEHFRLLWMSMLFFFTAMQMSFVAQGILVYRLSNTATAIGLVSLAWGITQLPSSLIAGVAADRLSKRGLVVFSQSTMAVTALITAVLAQTGAIEVWHIFVLALFNGFVFSFTVPARQAWIPELVGQEQLMNAVALNSAAFTFCGILGPALAAMLIAVPAVDIAQIYFLMTACYVAVVLMVLRVPGGQPLEGRERENPIRELMGGFRYVRSHPTLPYVLLMGFIPIVLAMPYRQFFPVFTEEVYSVNEDWVGVMGAVMAIGALIGALGVASLSNTSRRSTIQIVGGLAFGIGLVLFAAASNLWFGLATLLFVGLASNGYWALNNTLVLTSSSPEFYGRVMSVYMISWAVMPFVALPESLLADLVGVQWMVGGVGVLLLVALVAIALLLPGQRERQDGQSSEPPA